MPSHAKVKLSDVHALTFYAGEKTVARRTGPIDQLKCIGKPCRKFQPDVVRCTNTGGSGVDVDWKCETDLPSSLRLGRVEVSCEGWARPGDPYVLKGSCGLEYHLLEVPKAFRDDHTSQPPASATDYFNKALDWGFFVLFAAVAAFLAFKILEGCFGGPQQAAPRAGPRPGGGGGTGSGWFGGNTDSSDPHAPPPPYTKDANPSGTPAGGWRPGFFTGLGLGGLMGRYFRPSPYDPYARREQQQRYWDWDQPFFTRTRPAPPPPPPTTSERASSSSWFGGGGGTNDNTARPAAPAWPDTDRGEGSSSGVMRSSTGYGGSRVR